MIYVSDIKLIRTNITLYLGQKAKKGTSCKEAVALLLYPLLQLCSLKATPGGTKQKLKHGLAATCLVYWIVWLVITTPHVGGLRPITGPSSAGPITSP